MRKCVKPIDFRLDEIARRQRPDSLGGASEDQVAWLQRKERRQLSLEFPWNSKSASPRRTLRRAGGDYCISS